MGYFISAGDASYDIYLVLHQGNKWRNHNSSSFLEQGRKLVTKGFSATGGHQNEGVMIVHDAANNLLLLSFEGTEAKNAF